VCPAKAAHRLYPVLPGNKGEIRRLYHDKDRRGQTDPVDGLFKQFDVIIVYEAMTYPSHNLRQRDTPNFGLDGRQICCSGRGRR
jgi:hypothetical protein